MIDSKAKISVKVQCRLFDIARSTAYHKPMGRKSGENIILRRIIDTIYTKHPFFGARRMSDELKQKGYDVGRKRAARLMKEMGLSAVYCKPNLSKPCPAHKKYPYLLSKLEINRPDQVWTTDITYIPMPEGHAYLVVIMDWYSRKALSWRLSNTLDSGFCVEALEEAIWKYGKPDIFNSDQGVQFTSDDFTGTLLKNNIRISMDGRGRWMDNVFIERLWRTLKYEDVYLKAYGNIPEARLGIGEYLEWYNSERRHSSHGKKTPDQVYFDRPGIDLAA